MQLLGIQFAPINVPLERRLQTFAIAAWIVTFYSIGIVGPLLTAYVLFYTKLWYLMVLYLIWIWIIDKDIGVSGGRPSLWLRSWIWWKYIRDYFPLRFKTVPDVELDPKKNYLFCLFPHGLLAIGALNAFGSEYGNFRGYFPSHKTYLASCAAHYKIPFMRELALSMGGISASAQSINYVLNRPEGGQVCVLLVGGMQEPSLCRPRNYSIYLGKRKGFIKLALKNGTPLVPVLSFGETDLFREIEIPFLKPLQKMLTKWSGKPPAVLMGRGFFQYTFGIIPRRVPVTTVVGKPLEVPKIEDPTGEQVNEYHAIFSKALTDLFEEQKYNYVEHPEDIKLDIC